MRPQLTAPAPTVLLVEDEDLVLLMIQDALEEAGFQVIASRSGEDAIRVFEERGDLICAVVTDINLGAGMSGWEVARCLRGMRPHVGVLFVTGDSAHDWAAQGVPASVLIDKPFAPVQVVTAVAALLNRSDPTTA